MAGAHTLIEKTASSWTRTAHKKRREASLTKNAFCTQMLLSTTWNEFNLLGCMRIGDRKTNTMTVTSLFLGVSEWNGNGMRCVQRTHTARNVNFVLTHICTLSRPTLTPSPPSRGECRSHRGLTLEHVSTVEPGIARDAEALTSSPRRSSFPVPRQVTHHRLNMSLPDTRSSHK